MAKTQCRIFKRLIDCDALLCTPAKNISDCRETMAGLQISARVVRNRDSLRTAPEYHNQQLLQAVAGDGTLIPALFLTPDGVTPEYDLPQYLQRCIAAGLRIAWTAPVLQPYLLEYPFRAWCAGELFAALSRHRLPLLLEWPDISFTDLHEVLSAFPELRVIVTGLNRLGRQHTVEVLLQQHPGLYLCFSPRFSVHGGYASLCRRYGAGRFVWGSGYPEAEGGAALAGLLYAGLEPLDLQQVAYLNIERLLQEVRP